jgi:hypothetical protein
MSHSLTPHPNKQNLQYLNTVPATGHTSCLFIPVEYESDTSDANDCVHNLIYVAQPILYALQDTHPAVLPSLLSIIEAAGGAAAVAAAIQEALSSPAITAALSPLQPLRPVTRQLLASALEVDSGNGGAVRQSDYQGTHSERRLVWFPQDDGRYLATIAPLVKSAAEFASAHLADLMRGDLKSQVTQQNRLRTLTSSDIIT